MRTIQGLRWARRCDKPSFVTTRRPRGSKGIGIKYEKVFKKAFPSAIHGQWFEFEDKNGPGICQTDFLFRHFDRIVVVECKLSLTDEAFLQLQNLYLPVVSEAFRLKTLSIKARGLVVTKNLRTIRHPFKLAATLEEALCGDDISVLQWLGAPISLQLAA